MLSKILRKLKMWIIQIYTFVNINNYLAIPSDIDHREYDKSKSNKPLRLLNRLK